MNKIEVIKAERDGLDIRHDIERFAKTGWGAIEEADVQRLKWVGLFLRNPTPGYFMVRVRIPGGMATSTQLRTLAEVATTYGNGVIDVTTRQQLQLRHLTIEHVPEVFRRMDEVGLWSIQTGMDNVRNIMTCPVAGLTSSELIDTTPLVCSLSDKIVGNRDYSNLPRKLNMAITGCLENCLHLETQDLAFVPATIKPEGALEVGFNVLVGGKIGSGGYRIASPLDMFVRPSEVVQVTCAILSVYRDHGFRDSRNTARLAFLLDDWGEERFRREVENRLGRPYARAGVDVRKKSVNDHMGIYRQKSLGLNYVGLKIPVGRIKAGDLLKMAQLSETYGTGELRLAHNQAMVIPHVADRTIADLTEEPLLKQFVYNPSPIQKGLVSCVGNDYCNLAVIETKSRAVETARKVEAKLGTDLKPITMHWSGCPAGCGNHLVADVGLLGKKVKVKGEIIEAVDVYVGGRSGPDPKPATKLLEDVPCDVLPDVLSGIVPYHARQKMHQTKVRILKKPAKIYEEQLPIKPDVSRDLTARSSKAKASAQAF
ncbi:MAG: ferredoxin--nitrite reductase [Nitrospirales bacterium]|nr:MAG: ferredoxin--nitrite reductase [Nitrospirales bacterium]